jgi:manganese efflux pump family protein
MLALILLGFALGLDSFRVSLGLGSLCPRPARRRRIALAFGLCDGVAPLVGMALGREALRAVGPWTQYLGPLVLAGYGLYALYDARAGAEGEGEAESGWVVWGLPLTLSFDNFAAGVGLGVLEFPALLSAAVIGTISGLMSLAGLRLGKVLGGRLPLRAEMFGGLLLILLAVALAFDLM